MERHAKRRGGQCCGYRQIDNIRWNGRIESKKEENYGHVAIPQLTIAAI